ncbi:MAG: hypothetical protein LC624_04990, partial [Halobacteriales archaeon]|nr:hypothetical protein [Halobacteriales archaeon]
VLESVSLSLGSAAWPDGQGVVPGTARLEPGAGLPVLALVRAPADASSAAPQAAAELKARNASTALGNATLALPLTSATSSPPPAYGFALDPTATDPLVASGGQADATLHLRNTGGTEDAVRVTVAGLAPGWTVSLPAPFAVVPAGLGASGDVVVRAAANSSVPPGSSVNATITAASVNRDLQQVLGVTFRASAPDLALGSVAFDKPALYAGDVASLRVEVRNLGDVPLAKPARVSLVAAQGASSFPVAEQLVNGVGPGDVRVVTLAWDTTGFQGPYDVTVQLDASSDVAELHEDNNAQLLPVVVRTAGLAVDAPGLRTARPGQSLDYPAEGTFRVRNLGNAVERVRLDIGTAQGWLQERRTLTLGPGQEQAVPFTLAVPGRPGAVSEALTGTATVENHTATSVVNATRVVILDSEPPVLVRLDAPDFVELGQPALFHATLTDAVGIRSASLVLRQPDGTLQRVAFDGGADDRFNAIVVLAQPGTVSYWLSAVDSAPSNNTLNTEAQPAALLVGVRTAPVLELLSPHDGASIRPGTQVQLRITDIHGIGSVTVHDGARTSDLAEPWTIGTTGWSEGPHALNVTARNRFGNAASLAFTVVIDGTPPLVRDARLDPAQPKPGEAFTVSARASSDAVRAALQVRKDGQVVREVPADLGSQLATATLALDAGAYTLTMRVEDEAGNAAGADVGVSIGQGVPGFEPLGSLGVLGLALLLRRR